MMGSKNKLPKDYKLRKRLIKFLSKEGYSTLYIAVLLGYNIQQLPNIEVTVLNSQLQTIYMSDNESRKKIVDEHIKRMEEKNGT